MKKTIYLDNAATSFPKPPQVVEAMVHFMTEVGANPGRSGHRLSIEAERIVQSARESLALLFNIPDPLRIIFTPNVTESLNLVFNGLLKRGDHVITTGIEHNSVIRPLKYLEEIQYISLSIARCDRHGFLDIDEIPRLLRTNTALIVVNHASNVCGTLQNIKAVKMAAGEIPLLVDAAQTAGIIPIDVQAEGIDFLAFTGHKSLMGPQGIGGLYLSEGRKLEPFNRGGTGSESENLRQPEFLPDALESGTRNNVGIAGLGAAVDFILSIGVEKIREHEQVLTKMLLDELHDVQGLTLYGPLKPEMQTATLSVTFDPVIPMETDDVLRGCGSINLAWLEEGPGLHEAADLLNTSYDILVRTGLHCAPLAHQSLGTFPEGTLRLSIGYFNTPEDIERAAEALKSIAGEK
ncbi:MAG TPA: aminotransferase class V-fold PLP-dependent enzyme [Desulfobacteraceae bacterium]|nr:aminotransferase class V-fold PLP-dependent enzyme [Desulfobacteraceae bacterium]